MERFLRMVSFLGIYEVLLAAFPWWILLFSLQLFFFHARWLNVLLGGFLVYGLTAILIGRIARYWSYSLGLHRYILFPIPRWIAGVLIRGRFQLPKHKRYFLVHVRSNAATGKTVFREMREDVKTCIQKDYLNQSVLLGNTFGSFGFTQKKLLERIGEMEIRTGTFLPFQTVFLDTKRYQVKMFGRVLSSNTTWKIVKIESMKE